MERIRGTRQFTLQSDPLMALAPPIADALLRGATLLTASPRAARALHLDYAAEQRAAGHEVWPEPAILDWNSWLCSLWLDYAFAVPDAPLLLTGLQEQALWTRIQQADAAPLLSPEAMAALAMEAWSLLSAFEAHASRRHAWEQMDAESFRRWAAAFEEECRHHRWLSAAQLETALARHPGSVVLPPEIALAGFDRITPAQKSFLDALSQHGVRVSTVEPETGPAPQRQWLSAPDLRGEIAACADWARQRLAADPGSRIGIIVPSIEDVRGPLNRIFRRVLAPASEDIRGTAAPLPWEFSLGSPLADLPPLRAALLLLRWMAGPLPDEQIFWLMLSGFVSKTETNSFAAARHDALRRREVRLTPQSTFLAYRDSLAGNPALRAVYDDFSALLQFMEANQILSAERAASAWSELVPALLDRVGWPGSRAADSVLFQALQRWQRLLDELALLDFDGTRCRFSVFIDQLEAQARHTIFAPESHNAPIQILGPLESSGQQFDAIWFLSTDDTRWPLRGSLHPLLPPDVQIEHELPHFHPDDDWKLAHAVTARLLASASQIVFSCSLRDKDSELRPSPLIAGLFPPGAQPELAAFINLVPQALPTAAFEAIPDLDPLPWPSDQAAGGAEVLRRQAACPFQSFAVRRLAAEPVEAAAWGLDAAEKGKLLHKVLEQIFTRIRSLEELVAAADTEELESILDTEIEAAFSAHAPADAWQRAYIAAEQRRLRTRISEWLAIEATRRPFVVEACEQTLQDVAVGDLRLHLRADRVDRLPDESRLLIDYKTGAVKAAGWYGERPDEPQLPLYAAYGNLENVSGVLFAKIRAGETGFDGRIRDAREQLCGEIGARKGLVTDPYTDEMRDGWARVLTHLASDFLRGEAAVDPREQQVCDQCSLHALCRVSESEDAVAAEEDEETE